MKSKFYAIIGADEKGREDIIMDWDTEKLCIYDVKKRAYEALKQLKKHYPEKHYPLFKPFVRVINLK